MTKAGFLQKLRDALQDIPAADRDSALAYYVEQLDDRIEEGMTEAEAVESLGSLHEIVAALHEEGGAGTPTPEEHGRSDRPDPGSFRTERRPRTIALTEINNTVKLLPSPDEQIHIEYDVPRWISVTVSCDDDRLVYTARETFRAFRFVLSARRATCLYLPADYLPNLEIKTSNAGLSINDISCDTANCMTSNGSLRLAHLTANRLIVTTSNGALTATHITADAAQLTTSNAPLKAAYCTADKLTLVTSNGAIRAEHCTADTLSATTSNAPNTAEHITAHTINLKSSNGLLRLTNTTANDIGLKTSNAKISATLPGSIADYRIVSSGGIKSTIPTRKNIGEKSLSAATSNGNIDIGFAHNADTPPT